MSITGRTQKGQKDKISLDFHNKMHKLKKNIFRSFTDADLRVLLSQMQHRLQFFFPERKYGQNS